MKNKITLVLLLLSVAATTFVATTTFRPPQRLGPYYTSTERFDTATGNAPGGQVRIFKNGVDTIFVGEVVYVSANNTVRKSATRANYNTIAGVVVGGTKTNMQGVTSAPGATDTAALANQQVLVLTEGRTWVHVDTTTGGIKPGALIWPSLVAGKVKAESSLVDSFQRTVGRMIDTGIVSTRVLAHINIR